MNDLMNKFFGPLDKDYCVYFLILSILAAIGVVFSSFGLIVYIISQYKKLSFGMVLNLLLVSVNVFLVYLVNRLLHTMCVKSLA